ncbi:hypothetical protein BH09BAC6_BH09BAC6_00730 [soil metagenome]|jgi:hypothetical protein
MRFIAPKIHGIIDYLVVVFLFASPTMFEMTGVLATFTYALGAVHLFMTILTGYSVGIFKVIPFQLHGFLELIVGVAVIVVAYTLFGNDAIGKLYYIVFGTFLMLTWLVTDFRSADAVRV